MYWLSLQVKLIPRFSLKIVFKMMKILRETSNSVGKINACGLADLLKMKHLLKPMRMLSPLPKTKRSETKELVPADLVGDAEVVVLDVEEVLPDL